MRPTPNRQGTSVSYFHQDKSQKEPKEDHQKLQSYGIELLVAAAARTAAVIHWSLQIHSQTASFDRIVPLPA